MRRAKIMNEDEKYCIRTLLYLNNLINTKINNEISERICRGKEMKLEDLKESIIYVIDEQFSHIKRNVKE
jgi:hypothetical protein